MNHYIYTSIIIFLLVDISVIYSFFLSDWVVTNIGGEVEIGLWQTCLIIKKVPRCFVSTIPNEWILAIIFIFVGCLCATLTAITLIASLKNRPLIFYARWFGLGTLICYCLASIFIPMGFTMNAINGEPFQLPASYTVIFISLEMFYVCIQFCFFQS